MTDEAKRWRDGYLMVADALAPESTSFDQLAEIARRIRAERDDYKQRHTNQVKANEEDWTVFKSIAAALGMDSFRLVDLVSTAEAAKRVLEAARGVIPCTPTTVPLMDAIDAYDRLIGKRRDDSSFKSFEGAEVMGKPRRCDYAAVHVFPCEEIPEHDSDRCRYHKGVTQEETPDALKRRLQPLIDAANEVLKCADHDVARFGIEVPADIAWKFAHAVLHAEGDMELLENCFHCNRDKAPAATTEEPK